VITICTVLINYKSEAVNLQIANEKLQREKDIVIVNSEIKLIKKEVSHTQELFSEKFENHGSKIDRVLDTLSVMNQRINEMHQRRVIK